MPTLEITKYAIYHLNGKASGQTGLLELYGKDGKRVCTVNFWGPKVTVPADKADTLNFPDASCEAVLNTLRYESPAFVYIPDKRGVAPWIGTSLEPVGEMEQPTVTLKAKVVQAR